jgi:hypothetical protein
MTGHRVSSLQREQNRPVVVLGGVGPAHPDCLHFQQQLPGPGLGDIHLFQSEVSGGMEDSCLHRGWKGGHELDTIGDRS